MTEWWQERLCAFDVETTSPIPHEARIVQSAIVVCGGGKPTDEMMTIVDPGIPVPDEAAAIHGWTTERVRAEGIPPAAAIPSIIDALAALCSRGLPLIVFNARYDLTVLDREARRLGIRPLQERVSPLYVLCPLTVDKHLDRYRKSYPGSMTPEQAAERGVPSSRTLSGMAAHYGARLDDAHAATADALAAARVMWRIAVAGRPIRRVRNAQEAAELEQLEVEWASIRGDLPRLCETQRRWALTERDRFAEYKASVGEHAEAAAIRSEVDWPVLQPLPGAVDVPSNGGGDPHVPAPMLDVTSAAGGTADVAPTVAERPETDAWNVVMVEGGTRRRARG